MGKTVTTFMILTGIVVIAMPVGVIGSNFSNEYEMMLKEREKKKKMLAQSNMEQAMIRELKKRKKNNQGHQDDAEEDDPDDEPELAEDLRRMNALLDKSILLESEITDLLPETAAKVVQ